MTFIDANNFLYFLSELKAIPNKRVVLRPSQVLFRTTTLEYDMPCDISPEFFFSNTYKSEIRTSKSHVVEEHSAYIVETTNNILFEYMRRDRVTHYQGPYLRYELKANSVDVDYIHGCVIPMFFPLNLYPWMILSDFLAPLTLLSKLLASRPDTLSSPPTLLFPFNLSDNNSMHAHSLARIFPVKYLHYDHVCSFDSVVYFPRNTFIDYNLYSQVLQLLSP